MMASRLLLERFRLVALRTAWAIALPSREERPDGYEFVLEGTDEALTAASTFACREAERCSFARFEIAVPQGLESVRPPFAGPDGTKDLFETGLVEAFGIAV